MEEPSQNMIRMHYILENVVKTVEKHNEELTNLSNFRTEVSLLSQKVDGVVQEVKGVKNSLNKIGMTLFTLVAGSVIAALFALI